MVMPDGKVIQPTGRSYRVPMVTLGHGHKEGLMFEECLFWDKATFINQFGVAQQKAHQRLDSRGSAGRGHRPDRSTFQCPASRSSNAGCGSCPMPSTTSSVTSASSFTSHACASLASCAGMT